MTEAGTVSAVLKDSAKPTVNKVKKSPKTSEIVMEAMNKLNEKRGVSLIAIKKYIKNHFPEYGMNRSDLLIKNFLRKKLADGTFSSKGNSLTASIKIVSVAKPKEKSEAAKEKSAKKGEMTKERERAKKEKKIEKAAKVKKPKTVKAGTSTAENDAKPSKVEAKDVAKDGTSGKSANSKKKSTKPPTHKIRKSMTVVKLPKKAAAKPKEKDAKKD